MIDLVSLDTKVRAKAEEYLDDINEDNLKSFAESTKAIALSVLENYFFEIDRLYSDGVLRIQDESILDKFTDFKNGYRSQMKKWVHENGITLKEMRVSSSLDYPKLDDIDITKTPKKIAGIGTLIAAGLFVFSKLWVATTAELLALGAAAYVYKRNNELQEAEFKCRMKKYELKIEQEKMRMINGIIAELKEWLNNAEKYSNHILNTFGID